VSEGSRSVVVAALIVNVAIAAFKFVAAYFSRSSAMLAEACHSLADTINQLFLIVGIRRSARPPDEKHPFGYGPETYFWSFMVALSIFALGAGFSVHEGVEKIWHRHDPSEKLGNELWAYATLGVSILLESYSLMTAMKEFRHISAGRGVRRTLKEARDTTVLAVLFEDIAALFGLGVAFTGIALTHVTGNVAWDGAASIVVGLALGGVAFILGRDAQSLLIGKGMNRADDDKIREIVTAEPDVLQLVHLRTMHMGPEEVIAAIKIHFSGDITVRQLEVRINEIEAKLRAALPQLRRIYVEPGFDESIGRKNPGAA
jgi:cation diffusion facilitator family transporter